jgi:hypothetical protein
VNISLSIASEGKVKAVAKYHTMKHIESRVLKFEVFLTTTLNGGEW